MTKHIANILTACRTLGSIFLFFFPVFSVAFYITYLFCGFSDMIDGIVAKKTNSTGKFGSRFDAAADLIFTVVSSFKLLPAIHLPGWFWIWVVMIAAIKIGNAVWGLISHKKLISLHTVLNKVTGFSLFLLPLTLSFIEPIYPSVLVCFLATLSAINEMYHTRIGKEIF